MKLNYIILAIVLIQITVRCNNFGQSLHDKEIHECKTVISKSLNCINQFYFKKDTLFLDSALYYLKSIENKCSELNFLIANDEVHAYFLKNDFNTALSVLRNVNDSLFPFLEFKKVLQYKILAKDAEKSRNFIEQKRNFNKIISIYNGYIENESPKFDSVMRSNDVKLIEKSQFNFVLYELFYYISKTYDIENTILKIDSLQRKINGNPFYFDELKKFIRNEPGYSMTIILN